ncbi:uncharacterized protein LOC123300337 [Chrysoperla carnea]|uniref:uncharacterized protein LOC123300337 n=1 Tax=Chrysoperla carnea TaxID=189513 RepID=UPI001D0913DF|nr:uncharacterized protein LOC123300337 [Chrysoperla carnea]
MEAPTVDKILARKALSSKKATPKSIRTVLATPRENYRSVISNENATHVAELITKLFGTHKSIPKIPWKEIRGIPKDKRKEFRQNYVKDHVEFDRSIKKTHKCFILGINRIIKKLEDNQIMAVILDSDILEMSTIYNFISRLCQLKKTPFILLENLGTLLLNSIGIRSHTLGFTKQTDCSYFEPIITKIKEFSAIKEESPVKLDKQAKVEVMEVETKKEEPKKLYLYRDSTKSRVFTPCASLNKMEMDTSDFIAFSKTEESSTVEYVPLKLSVLQSISNQ